MRWNLGCTVDAAIRQGRTVWWIYFGRRKVVWNRRLYGRTTRTLKVVEYCSYRFNTLYQHLSSKTQDRNKNKASSTLT
ncbi:hypothetical protein BY996DRAFT_6553065 [Phakopsora pachyrhizi]|nr:hypothetical protein BY996DRAFT_6553065 [Phakopsora pachyrhizi]